MKIGQFQGGSGLVSQLKQGCASPEGMCKSGIRTCTKGEETLLSGPHTQEKIHNYIIMGVPKSESRVFSPACGLCLRLWILRIPKKKYDSRFHHHFFRYTYWVQGVGFEVGFWSVCFEMTHIYFTGFHVHCLHSDDILSQYIHSAFIMTSVFAMMRQVYRIHRGLRNTGV